MEGKLDLDQLRKDYTHAVPQHRMLLQRHEHSLTWLMIESKSSPNGNIKMWCWLVKSKTLSCSHETKRTAKSSCQTSLPTVQ
jgi:hypothetical protein